MIGPHHDAVMDSHDLKPTTMNLVPMLMAAMAAVWVLLGWNRPVGAIDLAEADYLDFEEAD